MVSPAHARTAYGGAACTCLAEKDLGREPPCLPVATFVFRSSSVLSPSPLSSAVIIFGVFLLRLPRLGGIIHEGIMTALCRSASFPKLGPRSGPDQSIRPEGKRFGGAARRGGAHLDDEGMTYSGNKIRIRPLLRRAS